MSERPFFVVGCPRSGTTLFRDVLRSHPRLTIAPESGGLPKLYRRHGDPRSRREARLLATDFLRSHSLRLWQLELEPSDLEEACSFAALVSAVYEAWARKRSKPRWGDKTPQHVLAIPLLARLFPTAQFVHVIRDGRDVALSLAAKGWGQRSPYTAAVFWRRCVEAGLGDGRPLGPERYHELSYEELITRPEPTLRRVCAFLDEDFDPAVLRPTRIPVPSSEVLWPAAFEHEIHADNCCRWKRELPPADRAVFESVAGELLRRVGYKTERAVRAPGRSERLRWRARDVVGLVHWRMTTWDRVPRAQTTLLHSRSLVLKWLGRTGARARGT